MSDSKTRNNPDPAEALILDIPELKEKDSVVNESPGFKKSAGVTQKPTKGAISSLSVSVSPARNSDIIRQESIIEHIRQRLKREE